MKNNKNRWARLGRDADKDDPKAGGGGDPKADPDKDDPKADPDKDDPPKDTKQHSAESFAAIKAEKLKAQTDLAAAQKQLQEIADSKLSKEDKLTKDHAEASTKAEAAEKLALKLEIALDKGLTRKQAMRLVGTTKEELEADADDVLEENGGTSAAAKLKGKPKANLKGGGDPDDEDAADEDPIKLAAKMRARSGGGLRTR